MDSIISLAVRLALFCILFYAGLFGIFKMDSIEESLECLTTSPPQEACRNSKVKAANLYLLPHDKALGEDQVRLIANIVQIVFIELLLLGAYAFGYPKKKSTPTKINKAPKSSYFSGALPATGFKAHLNKKQKTRLMPITGGLLIPVFDGLKAIVTKVFKEIQGYIESLRGVEEEKGGSNVLTSALVISVSISIAIQLSINISGNSPNNSKEIEAIEESMEELEDNIQSAFQELDDQFYMIITSSLFFDSEFERIDSLEKELRSNHAEVLTLKGRLDNDRDVFLNLVENNKAWRDLFQESNRISRDEALKLLNQLNTSHAENLEAIKDHAREGTTMDCSQMLAFPSLARFFYPNSVLNVCGIPPQTPSTPSWWPE